MINTWNESLLHEELKDYYCGENGLKEVPLNGSICDAIRSDGTIIEIQTANLGQLKTKLEKLLVDHKVILIHPIARNTVIETYDTDSQLISRRKSPKHGSVYQIFQEITRIYHLFELPGFTLQIIFADILEIRIADGTGSWRRKGIRRDDKKLIKMHETLSINGTGDLAGLIPESLPEPFTVANLKERGAGLSAGHMAWVLRKLGVIIQEGKKGNAYVYRINTLHKDRQGY